MDKKKGAEKIWGFLHRAWVSRELQIFSIFTLRSIGLNPDSLGLSFLHLARAGASMFARMLYSYQCYWGCFTVLPRSFCFFWRYWIKYRFHHDCVGSGSALPKGIDANPIQWILKQSFGCIGCSVSMAAQAHLSYCCSKQNHSMCRHTHQPFRRVGMNACTHDSIHGPFTRSFWEKHPT